MNTYLDELTRHHEHVEEQLVRVPQPGKVAFAASCAEQLFPIYVLFVEAEGWGDAEVMRRALDASWACASGDNGRPREMQKLLDAAFEATPHTDDFRSLLGSGASSAGLAVVSAVHCCLHDDAEQAAAAGEYVLELPDQVLAPTDDAKEIPPLTAAEIARQRRVLDALEVSAGADVTAVRDSIDPQPFLRLVRDER